MCWYGLNHKDKRIYKKTSDFIRRFFVILIFYRNPFERQQPDAAARQSEYSLFGLRRSRHGCQPLQRLFEPVPEHFA